MFVYSKTSLETYKHLKSTSSLQDEGLKEELWQNTAICEQQLFKYFRKTPLVAFICLCIVYFPPSSDLHTYQPSKYTKDATILTQDTKGLPYIQHPSHSKGFTEHQTITLLRTGSQYLHLKSKFFFCLFLQMAKSNS